MGHVERATGCCVQLHSPYCAAIDCVTINPSHAPSRLQFRDKFYPSHIEVSKSHFAAVHESGIGMKLPIRDVRSSVATGGKPDIVRKAGFGSV
jgi:hypothetical protein